MDYYYDKKFCKIWYDEGCDAVVLSWEGFATSQGFREACDSSLDLLKARQCRRLIADNSRAKAILDADQQWLAQDWMARAFAEGYRTSAVILSEDMFRNLAVKNIESKMDMGVFTVSYFSELEAAGQWLRENPQL